MVVGVSAVISDGVRRSTEAEKIRSLEVVCATAQQQSNNQTEQTKDG